MSTVQEEAGVLTLAAVPIGRAEDASPRLAAALAAATIIAAEDSRRVRWLAASLSVELKARVVSYYDAVEASRTARLLESLKAGQDVLLVTDAGTPGISDPGYRLVAAAAEAGIRVTALPGPSAVTTALAVSGLPTDRFCFEGFPPRRPGDRNRRFAELAADARTQVYFESGRRLADTLDELAASHGADRQVVVCRELTKTHEEIVRGTLAELAAWARSAQASQAGSRKAGDSGAVRGEITLVVAGLGRRGRRDAVSAGRDPVSAGRDAVSAGRDAVSAGRDATIGRRARRDAGASRRDAAGRLDAATSRDADTGPAQPGP
jgi:16S rRNA (cytidine1402-2'-O)-methyltransferase